jgi:DNA topoisomerase IA
MMKKQKEIENFVPTKKWEIVGSFNLFENRELKYCHEKTIDLSRDHVEGVLSNIRNKWSLAASEIKNKSHETFNHFNTAAARLSRIKISNQKDHDDCTKII